MNATTSAYNLTHVVTEQIKDFLKQPTDDKARALAVIAYTAESLGISAFGPAFSAVSPTPHIKHFLAMKTEMNNIRASLMSNKQRINV